MPVQTAYRLDNSPIQPPYCQITAGCRRTIGWPADMWGPLLAISLQITGQISFHKSCFSREPWFLYKYGQRKPWPHYPTSSPTAIHKPSVSFLPFRNHGFPAHRHVTWMTVNNLTFWAGHTCTCLHGCFNAQQYQQLLQHRHSVHFDIKITFFAIPLFLRTRM